MKIVGCEFDKFQNFCQKNENQSYLKLRPAKLIPLPKTKTESALTSVFLSALRLVKEFREYFCSEIHMSSSGKIYIFTEIDFPNQTEEKRIDGLFLIVRAKKIVDAALFEIKQGNNFLNKEQIED